MSNSYEDSAEGKTKRVETMLEEARLLFPSFIKDGQLMSDTDLARLGTYSRFLRLGILIWLAECQDDFRQILKQGFACEGCAQDEARAYLEYLWKGIETGCVVPSSP